MFFFNFNIYFNKIQENCPKIRKFLCHMRVASLLSAFTCALSAPYYRDKKWHMDPLFRENTAHMRRLHFRAKNGHMLVPIGKTNRPRWLRVNSTSLVLTFREQKKFLKICKILFDFFRIMWYTGISSLGYADGSAIIPCLGRTCQAFFKKFFNKKSLAWLNFLFTSVRCQCNSVLNTICIHNVNSAFRI